MFRIASRFVGLALLVTLMACQVQAHSESFDVFGTEPKPYSIGWEYDDEGNRVTDDEGNYVTVMATPTPIYTGFFKDWNIQGVEYITPTPSPKPSPTPAYQKGELILNGQGPITLSAFALPNGRYIIHYRVSKNEGNNYCIAYGDFSVGCNSGSKGDLSHRKRVTIDYVASLTIEIGPEARYFLKFERVD